MSLINFMIILLSVLLNSAAQLFLKKGSSVVSEVSLGEGLIKAVFKIFSHWQILGGLACYGLSVGVWIFALSRVDVGKAYPMLSIGFIVTVLAAYLFFGEPLGVRKILGVGLISIGVLIISKS